MKGYARVWTEDDAPVPDKETLRGAYKRLTGRDWEHKQYFQRKEDHGDAIYYYVFGGWLVVASYPGASAIYKECGCAK